MGRSLLSFAGTLLVLGLSFVAARAEAREHVVASGQTLARIAKRYNVTLDEICTANSIRRSDRLKPGTRLIIPTGEDAPKAKGDAPKAKGDGPKAKGDAPKMKGRSDKTESPRIAAAEKPSREKSPTNSTNRYLKPPPKRGWVHVVGYHGEYQGQLLSPRGILYTKGADAISRVLAWPRRDYRMDSRLLTLLARTSDAFGGRPLRIVSGFRTSSYSSESKHPLGRACDFSVLGVPNEALRDFLRTYQRVGVGYYPNSSFVHLDVREVSAYWVDYAGPGEPPRMSPRAPRAPDAALRASTSPGAATEPAVPGELNPKEPAQPTAETDSAEPTGAAPPEPAPERPQAIAHAAPSTAPPAPAGGAPREPPSSDPSPTPKASAPAEPGSTTQAATGDS